MRAGPLALALALALVVGAGADGPEDSEWFANIAHRLFLCPARKLPTEAGRVCDFDLAADKSYLPSPAYLTAAEQSLPQLWRAQAEAFLRQVNDVQRVAECDEPQSADAGRWHVVKFKQAGVGFNLHLFVDTLLVLWMRGLPVLVSSSKWRFSDGRCGNGYTCHLRKLSDCDITDVPLDKIAFASATVGSTQTAEEVCRGESGQSGSFNPTSGRCECATGLVPHAVTRPGGGCEAVRRPEDDFMLHRLRDDFQTADWPWHDFAPGINDISGVSIASEFPVLPEFQSAAYLGRFFMHATLLHDLLTTSDAWPATLREVRRSGSISGTCVAVHVRHGDACFDSFQKKRCFPLGDYMAAVEDLEARYGRFGTIVLATDDPQVVEEARSASGGRQLWVQDMERSHYAASDRGPPRPIDDRAELGEKELAEVLVDMAAMSTCTAFVGTFSSSIAWSVVELQAASHGYYTPWISLDQQYGCNQNVGRFFSFSGRIETRDPERSNCA